MRRNPQEKLALIRDTMEHRTIRSIMDTIDQNFGLDFTVEQGHVTGLQLAAAGLVVIPRQIKGLSFLRRLEVPANKIRRITNLESCEALEVINLADNELTTEGLRSLNHCKTVTELNLSMNRIDSMEPLSGLMRLKRLDLSQNALTHIAALELPVLEHLNLWQNPIEKLENLHRYPNLKEVKLAGKTLPPEEQALLEGQAMNEIIDYCRNE